MEYCVLSGGCSTTTTSTTTSSSSSTLTRLDGGCSRWCQYKVLYQCVAWKYRNVSWTALHTAILETGASVYEQCAGLGGPTLPCGSGSEHAYSTVGISGLQMSSMGGGTRRLLGIPDLPADSRNILEAYVDSHVLTELAGLESKRDVEMRKSSEKRRLAQYSKPVSS
jgi:hypothetical protein